MNIREKIKHIKTSMPGFTLVELLLYMGLSMILLVIISGLLVSTLSIRNEAEKTSSLEREGRYIMARLSYDIYSAQDIVEPATIGDNSTQLQILINSELITYRIINNKLYLIDNSGTHLMSGENVSATNFNVLKLGNDGGVGVVEISVTAESENISEGKVESRDYKTVVTTR